MPSSIHNMLLLLSISLLFAVSSGLKAVQFGETRSAETLFPSSSLTLPLSPSIVPSLHDPELVGSNSTKPDDTVSESADDDETLMEQLEITDEGSSTRGINIDDHSHNKDSDDWGPYVPRD